MPAPSLDTFKLRFPEFGERDDDTISFWISDVDNELCESSFGNCYGVAVETLAAHKMALSNSRKLSTRVSICGTASVKPQGFITSASADGLSVGFATPRSATSGTSRETYLSQTPYGIEYLSIRAKCLPRGRLARCR